MAGRAVVTLVLLQAAGGTIFSLRPLHNMPPLPPLPPQPHVRMPNLPAEETLALLARATQTVRDREDGFEPTTVNKGVVLSPGSPAWFMALSRTSLQHARNLSHHAFIAEEATKYIAQVFRLSREQVSFGLPLVSIKHSPLGANCPQQVDYPCQPRKYRAYSGYCNNVQSPRWGASNTRLLRYLPPDYFDGVSLPRGGGLSSSILPGAREVSLAVHGDADLPHQHLMAITPVWGEFLAHDLAHVPQTAGFEGHQLKCCGVVFADFHPECFPIRLPDSDPVHSKLGERCQDYVRSAPAPRTGCTLGTREQMNQVTSFLDGSAVYGSSAEQAEQLREFAGGRLKTQNIRGGKPLLPSNLQPHQCREHPVYRCFLAGDQRVNENVGVAAVHTLWMREHNRLAEELANLNPQWEDETLYQEARRVVIAEIQHITYNEYLPMVLGQNVMDQYGLNLETSGHYNGYDINLNPGTANVVAAAALHFVSSLLPRSISIVDRAGRETGRQDLAGTAFSPFSLYESLGVDAVLQGLVHGPAQVEDNHINEVMTNHMFQDSRARSGLDMAAQVIQQGRDHAIPSYTRWRQFCQLPAVRTFDDLTQNIPRNVVNALRSVYKNVSDIDLFPGALAETPLTGAVVGPTLACILGRQFYGTRRGDRFWYENDLPPSSFSREQLHELRKVSLARVLCDNADEITEIQPLVFLDKDPFLNAMMSCEKGMVKRMDLTAWKAARRVFHLSPSSLTDAARRAQTQVRDLIAHDSVLFTADPTSPVGTAFGFNRPKRQAAEIANTSLVLQFMSSRFVNSFLQGQLQDLENGGVNDIGPRDVAGLLTALQDVDLSEVLELPRALPCDEQALPCDHTAPFRSITGWCNNLRSPGRGKSLRAFSRLLPPLYGDGVGSPRQRGRDGSALPSPRLVSTLSHPDTSRPHRRYSLLLMQFAQLLDHDLTHTPVNRAFVGEAILDCRPCDAMTAVHPECFPIQVPNGDPYFPKLNSTTGKPLCIPFTRSMPGQLTLGHREQMNQVTAYVDASFVYGSDVCESKVLRSFIGGRLNVTTKRFGKPLLPQINTHPECKAASKVCFRGGDARASEQPALTAIHTAFLREHNRLATQLAALNPHWTDEVIYQNARRILSAATQHIVYSELLPRILGWDGIYKYGLDLLPEGYYKDYDESCDATIVNEFASAAFRFGHSLLKPSLPRLNPEFKPEEPFVRLRDTFFNPEVLYQPNMVDELLRGLAATPMENLDEFITNEVTNHLFEDHRMPHSGMDLAAINIQRGRDHGIRGYNSYRGVCNLTVATNFDGIKRDIAPQLVEALRRVYAHVDDIDLFPGGLSEAPLLGGVVGPTFACIIGEQFRRLRRCDRFWYEGDDPLVRFTEAQLAEIRKVSLAKLICDNSDRISAIQRHALDLPDPFLNPIAACAKLPELSLEPWKERQTCAVGGNNIAVGAGRRVSPCVMCTCTKEGPMCQSLKVANCLHLIRSYSQSAVLGDDVCKVQCAYVLRAYSAPLSTTKHGLGFS